MADAKSAEATAKLTQVLQPLFAGVVREVKDIITVANLEAGLESRKLDGILHTKINEINDQLQQIYGEITDIKAILSNINDKQNVTKDLPAKINAPGVLYKDPGPNNDMFRKDDDDLTFD
jgi:hypothetical protein